MSSHQGPDWTFQNLLDYWRSAESGSGGALSWVGGSWREARWSDRADWWEDFWAEHGWRPGPFDENWAPGGGPGEQSPGRDNPGDADVGPPPDGGQEPSGNVINGTNLDDMLVGSAGIDLINGLDGNDTLLGNGDADVLDGGAGSDTATYESAVSAVDARLNAGEGFLGDALGDVYTDIENLVGSGFDDTLLGNAGANLLTGMAGDDHLQGGGGDDTLTGGEGGDTLDGGLGVDAVSYAAATSGVTACLNIATGMAGEAAGDSFTEIENLIGSRFDDTLLGDFRDNTLWGGAGDDTLQGGGGDDALTGGSGNDLLDGWDGADRLVGGDGNDTLLGGAGGDVLDGGLGIDVVSYAAASSEVVACLNIAAGMAGEAAGDSFADVENLIGTSFDDTLMGDFRDNTLWGGDGNDTLQGGAGDDTLVGGTGNDTMQGWDGDDLIVGNAGADSIDGGAGVDTVSFAGAAGGVHVRLNIGSGLGGEAQGDSYTGVETVIGSAFDDILFGNAANNMLDGGDGADVLAGGGGTDMLSGGAGNDTLDGSLGNDILIGGEGADSILGGDGIDTASYASAASGVDARLNQIRGFGGEALGDTYVFVENLTGSGHDDRLFGNIANNVIDGGAGSDEIRAGGGDDTLLGGAGNDTLDAWTGNDVLNGGDGDDWLTGWDGNDLFVFDTNSGDDTITDFAAGAGAGDVILIDRGADGPSSFAEVMDAASQSGADTIIDLGGGDTITLLGVDKATLHTDDFQF